MSEHAERLDDSTDAERLDAAGSRLDYALIGFNRHANLAEGHRRVMDQFRASRQAYEAGAAERLALRQARAAAAAHRALVRSAVGEFVRCMRDAGAPPERILVAVKDHLKDTVTAEAPAAPWTDASLLATDAGVWAIKAYYDAA